MMEADLMMESYYERVLKLLKLRIAASEMVGISVY
jgi:hypothetical protein